MNLLFILAKKRSMALKLLLVCVFLLHRSCMGQLFRQYGPDTMCSLDDPSETQTFPDGCHNLPTFTKQETPGQLFNSVRIACSDLNQPGMVLFSDPDCSGTMDYHPSYHCVHNTINGSMVAWTWTCLVQK